MQAATTQTKAVPVGYMVTKICRMKRIPPSNFPLIAESHQPLEITRIGIQRVNRYPLLKPQPVQVGIQLAVRNTIQAV